MRLSFEPCRLVRGRLDRIRVGGSLNDKRFLGALLPGLAACEGTPLRPCRICRRLTSACMPCRQESVTYL